MCKLLVDEAYGESIRQFEHYANTVQDIADLKEAVNDLTGDDEFGTALVDHFPIEDKMPTFSDVQDFLNNRFDTDYDTDTVDLICMIMELHYDIDYCQRCHDDEDALVETDVGYLCDRCARQSVGLPIAQL